MIASSSSSTGFKYRVLRLRHDKPVSARLHDPLERSASTACGTSYVQRRRPTTALACPRRLNAGPHAPACRPGRALTRALVRAPDDCIGSVKPSRLPSCSSSRARAVRSDPSEYNRAVWYRLAVRRDSRPGRAGSSSRFTRSTNRARAGRLFILILYYIIYLLHSYEMRLS